jgi:hypothetical protein
VLITAVHHGECKLFRWIIRVLLQRKADVRSVDYYRLVTLTGRKRFGYGGLADFVRLHGP